MPVSVARPVPVGLGDDLALRVDEDGHGALAILILGTATDTGEGRDAIVDDDSDLWIWLTLAGEYWDMHEMSENMNRERRLTLELDVGGEGREMRGLESAVFGHVVGRKRAVRGEAGQVQSRNH